MRNKPVTMVSRNLPRELLRSAPRPVVLTCAGVAAKISMFALLLTGPVVGGLLYDRLEGEAQRARRITAQSVPGRARVIEVRRTGRGENRRVLVSYSFSASSGGHTGTTRLRRRDRRQLAPGALVDIRYLPGAPAQSWIEGYGPGEPPVWVAPLLAAALAATALPIWRLLRRQRCLLEEGRPALATIEKATKRSGVHGETMWRVEYRWDLFSGAVRTARRDIQTKKPPETGTVFPILYDRENPRRHARYPLSLVRVEK